ncbi:MAG: dihydroorotate dehydrogenase-like protein [Planctomycetes bacterium]|nr:dihydroorotate dehydrogenase-like protein [Planctomycetota bacterium]
MTTQKPDLSTSYLGLQLKNPCIAGPGPLTGSMDSLTRLEEAGVAAVILPSLFEEQIEAEEMNVHGMYEDPAGYSPEASSYFPELEDYNTGPDRYLNLLDEAVHGLKIPVIASLNGYSAGGWTHYAKLIEDHGASALELNIYYVPTDPSENATAVEDRYLQVVSQLRDTISIPISVKIGPYFSALPHFAQKLQEAGADGLTLFNRYLHPDIALEEMKVIPRLYLSGPEEALLPLRWIAILKDRIPLSFGATSGIDTSDEAIKLLLAGADSLHMVSSLLRKGPAHVAHLISGLSAWMQEKDYRSVEQLKGSMCQSRSPNPETFERANYMKAITSFTSSFLESDQAWI